jgi:hypothetical protein
MPPLTMTQLLNIALPTDFSAKITSIATAVGLAPSSWKLGGITNTIINGLSNLLGLPAGVSFTTVVAQPPLDAVVTTILMGQFLDTATQVTNDNGTGWLDILGDSLYDNARIPAVKATGPVTLTNTSAITKGPYAIGAYHLYSATNQTYSNTVAFSIIALADTTTTFAADVAGTAGTAIANTLRPVTSIVGVTVKTAGGANANQLLGADVQHNASFITSCRGKLQSLNPKLAPDGAYQYFATQTNLTGYPTLAGGVINRANTSTDPLTGFVTITLANASGVPSGGDITLMTTYLTAVAKPDAETIVVQAATAFNVSSSLDVYVPASKSSVATAAVQAAFSSYIASLPLGGTVGPTLGIQRSEVIAAIFAAVPYVENILNLLMNTVATDLVMTSNQVAIATPATVVTVHTT